MDRLHGAQFGLGRGGLWFWRWRTFWPQAATGLAWTRGGAIRTAKQILRKADRGVEDSPAQNIATRRRRSSRPLF